MSCGGTESYIPTSVVRWFHDLPRFNRSLKSVSPEFDLSLNYAEGVAAWPAVLVVLGVLLLLVALFYLCCCACRSGPDLHERYTKRKSPGCNSVPLIFFALVCWGAAGLALYANEDVEKGVKGLGNTIQSINDTVVSAEQNVNGITINLFNASSDLVKLTDVWENSNLSRPVKDYVISATNSAKGHADSAYQQTTKISDTFANFYDVSPLKTQLLKYDGYRWDGTLAVMCAIFFVALVAIFGAVCASSCMLKMMVFFALLSLLVGWVLGAGFLAITVGGSDLCFSPNKFIDSHVADTNYAESVRYVIYCGSCPNPYQSDYDQAEIYIYNVTTQLSELSEFAQNMSMPDAVKITDRLTTNVDTIQKSLDTLWSQEINCTNLNAIYNDLLTSTCGKVIDGTALTFAGAAGIGLFMFFLILAAQRHWTRIIFKDMYEEDTETSQLLPPNERRSNGTFRSRDAPRDPAPADPPRRHRQETQRDGSTETLWLDTHVQTDHKIPPPKAGSDEKKRKQAWV
ncbi:protein tweety homolog 2-like [Sycon ciliatum]|uniref:protein tweety homolog 2-like n=1 Tax=Sycon ciliatum TaxID=27933 RepID=UPI0031F6805A